MRRHSTSLRIVYSIMVLVSSDAPVVNCYHTGKTVCHPFVSALEAIMAIDRTDVFY